MNGNLPERDAGQATGHGAWARLAAAHRWTSELAAPPRGPAGVTGSRTRPPGGRISAEAVQDTWHTVVGASSGGTIACLATWHTDSGADLPQDRRPRCWSCTAPPTGSGRPSPAGRGLMSLSPAASTSPSRAQRTACAAPTPTTATRSSSGSSRNTGLRARPCESPGKCPPKVRHRHRHRPTHGMRQAFRTGQYATGHSQLADRSQPRGIGDL